MDEPKKYSAAPPLARGSGGPGKSTDTARCLVAAAVASLGVLLVVLAEFAYSDIVQGGSYGPVLYVFIIAHALVGVLEAYVILMFFGLPIHLALQRIRARSALVYVLFGILAATLKVNLLRGLGVFGFGYHFSVPAGAVVALLFWWLAVARNQRRQHSRG